jgi:enoyl-CoA hydratase
MVHGYCIFGGWMIASAMDLIFAADDAMFLGTNFQYFSPPWDLHPRKVKEIFYESRFIDGAEAVELGFANRAYPADRLEAETMAYARRVAENDPFQLRMMKQMVNQAQEAQGFSQHIRGAHAFYLLSSQGEADPGFALDKPDGRRRPMVQRAVDNYELHRQAREDAE